MKYHVFWKKWNLILIKGFESEDSLIGWVMKNLPRWKLDGLEVVSPSGHVYQIRKESY